MRLGIVIVCVCCLLFTAANIIAAEYETIDSMKDVGERRVALVVGNAAYRAVPLSNPVNDANAMATSLTRCGFTVIKGQNMDRRGMRDAVRAFVKSLRNAEVGLFFYAGHGVQVDGKNYLVPLNADVQESFDVSDQCLEADYVLAAMEEAKAQLNIVILDACRDNPFRGFRSSRGGLAFMNAPSGSFVAFATSPGGVASDGGSRGHGLFTASLLKHLQTPGLRLTDLFINVRNEVVSQSKGLQEPWVNQSLGRQFQFVPGQGSSGPAPQPSVGSLQVRSTPSGARLMLDGSEKGKSPQTLAQLQPGEHVLRLELEDHTPEERVVSIEAGRVSSEHVQLTPMMASLTVTPTPGDAVVKIMNITPRYRDGIELSPGKYHVRVEKSGFRQHDEQLTLAANEKKRLAITLQPLHDERCDQGVWAVRGRNSLGFLPAIKELTLSVVGDGYQCMIELHGHSDRSDNPVKDKQAAKEFINNVVIALITNGADQQCIKTINHGSEMLYSRPGYDFNDRVEIKTTGKRCR